MRMMLMLLALAVAATPPLFAQAAWINAFHYDDAGSDEDEFVEVVLPDVLSAPAAPLLPEDVTVTLYNGSDGAAYGSHALDTFTAGQVEGGFTVYYKWISGIQNGGPDGLALDHQGMLLEFLCYEGIFTAAGGAADGVTCEDVGLEESNDTAAGQALQRVGTGQQGSDFSWAAGAASPGAINAGQSLGAGDALCADPATLPFWDGTVEPRPGGQGALPLQTAAGLSAAALDLAGAANIALLGVEDALGNIQADYQGQDPLGGTENSGFASLVYTGTPGGELTEARLLIGAREQGSSAFFIDVSDTCARTLHVDPHLSLFTGIEGDAAPTDVPTAPRLSASFPNPFLLHTTIPIALPNPAAVRLQVFDLTGRLITTLFAGTLDAGRSEIRWDGRMDNGARVPRGIYFYRLEAGPTVDVQTAIVL